MLHSCIGVAQPPLMATFADTLYLWRTEQGLTQETLAKASGIPRPNLSSLERGTVEPTLGTIRQLAAALQIRPGWLVDGIAPGGEERLVLTRWRMDRIANAVVKDRPLKNPYEQKVAQLLKTQLIHRQPSYSASRRKVRQIRHTWIQLRTLVPPSELNGFWGRIEKKRTPPA